MIQEDTFKFKITAAEAGNRLDVCLSHLISKSSRSFLQKLIREGHVSSNEGTALTIPRYPVREGMVIKVIMPKPADLTPAPEPFPFDILYEDDVMLVMNKPAGIVVHPAVGNPNGTVVNALIGRYPKMLELFKNTQLRPGIVHRLDKDTSGCLIVAKTPEAQFKLGKSFAEHSVKKSYLAICRGVPQKNSEALTTLIGRHPVCRQKMAIVERNGKLAITRYHVIATALIENIPLALLEVNIDTGRTHQIRVHLASRSIPVLGDEIYGGNRNCFPDVTRQLLHAWKVVVPHPTNGKNINICAPIPNDMLNILSKIKGISI